MKREAWRVEGGRWRVEGGGWRVERVYKCSSPAHFSISPVSFGFVGFKYFDPKIFMLEVFLGFEYFPKNRINYNRSQ